MNLVTLISARPDMDSTTFASILRVELVVGMEPMQDITSKEGVEEFRKRFTQQLFDQISFHIKPKGAR